MSKSQEKNYAQNYQVENGAIFDCYSLLVIDTASMQKTML